MVAPLRVVSALFILAQICFGQFNVVELTNTTNNLAVTLPPVSSDLLLTPTTFYLDIPINAYNWSVEFKKTAGCNNQNLNLFFNELQPPCTLPSSAGSLVDDLCITTPLAVFPSSRVYTPSGAEPIYAGRRVYFGVGKTTAAQAALNCPINVTVAIGYCGSTETGFFEWNSQALGCYTFANVSPLSPVTLGGVTSFVAATTILPNTGRVNISVTANSNALDVFGAIYTGNQFNTPTPFQAPVIVQGQNVYILAIDNPLAGTYWITAAGRDEVINFSTVIAVQSSICNATFGGADCNIPITILSGVTSTTQGTLMAGSAQIYKPTLSQSTYQSVTINATGGPIIAEVSRDQYPSGSDTRTIDAGANFTWIFSPTDAFGNPPFFISIRNTGSASVTYALAILVNASNTTTSSSASSSSMSSSGASSSTSQMSSSSATSTSASNTESSSSTSATGSSSSSQSTTPSSATSISSSIVTLCILFLATFA